MSWGVWRVYACATPQVICTPPPGARPGASACAPLGAVSAMMALTLRQGRGAGGPGGRGYGDVRQITSSHAGGATGHGRRHR